MNVFVRQWLGQPTPAEPTVGPVPQSLFEPAVADADPPAYADAAEPRTPSPRSTDESAPDESPPPKSGQALPPPSTPPDTRIAGPDAPARCRPIAMAPSTHDDPGNRERRILPDASAEDRSPPADTARETLEAGTLEPLKVPRWPAVESPRASARRTGDGPHPEVGTPFPAAVTPQWPSEVRAARATGSAGAAPDVTVTIGRVIVTGTAPSMPRAPGPDKRRGVMSLDQYLGERYSGDGK